MAYIGIDLGSTFIKGALLDVSANMLTHIERLPSPAPISGLPARRFEVDPLQIVATTHALLQRLAQHAAGPIDGVLMCSQMHGLVLMNARGEALSNAITWQDERALDPLPGAPQTYFDALLSRLPADAAAALGNELMPGRPLCTLFWLQQHGLLPEHAVAASLPDFVIASLTGQAPRTHPTNASGHALFDIRAQRWRRELLSPLGLHTLRLPELAGDLDEPAGTIQLNHVATPVYAAIGDQQAALLGAALQPGELSLNISTGSQVSLLSSAPVATNVLDSAVSGVQVRPYPGGLLLHTVTHIPAGRALNTLVALFGELAARAGQPVEDPWPLIAAAIAESPEGALDVDLRFFGGASRGQHAAGHIGNIREGQLTIGALMRAAFRSMAENYAAAAQQVTQSAAIERVVLSGGIAAQFGVLREAIQRALPMPQRLSDQREDTLIGLLNYVKQHRPR